MFKLRQLIIFLSMIYNYYVSVFMKKLLNKEYFIKVLCKIKK